MVILLSIYFDTHIRFLLYLLLHCPPWSANPVYPPSFGSQVSLFCSPPHMKDNIWYLFSQVWSFLDPSFFWRHNLILTGACASMVFSCLDGTWAHSLSWLPWRILQQMALYYADLEAFGYIPGRSVTRLYVVLFLAFGRTAICISIVTVIFTFTSILYKVSAFPVSLPRFKNFFLMTAFCLI